MKKITICSMLFLLAVFIALPTQHADALVYPVLTLNDGINPAVIIRDGLAGDSLLGIPGAVAFVGPIGSWTINVSTGQSDPAIPGPYPHMDLSSVNTSTAGGTMTIRWTDVWDVGQGTGFIAGIGGTLAPGATLTYNVLGGQDVPTTDVLSTIYFGTEGPFSGSTGGILPDFTRYYLTQQIILTHSGPGVSSFDAELTPVPEPGTMMLLGSGLVGLAGWGRKKFRK